MTAQQQAVFWFALLAGLGIFLWLLSSVLLPFVLGMAIAYCLAPLVAHLERNGLSRAAASGGILAGFLVIISLILLLLVPALIEQVMSLAARLPALVAWAQDAVLPITNRLMEKIGVPKSTLMPTQTADIFQRAASVFSGFLTKLVSEGLVVVDLLSLLALTPIVAFYFLRDWPKIIDVIDGWLPRQHAETIREQFRKIDIVLAGFVRGSATVCLVQGVFYATALTLVGLDFGLVIGLTAGAISFIPYLGAIFGLTSSVGVALYQFWPDWLHVAGVAVIFFTGQLLQDYVLTPRLIGNRVGLHPLWVIFGVLAGGALFGFVGVLLSVPACAVIGVLVRFAISWYKQSPLYAGGG